MYYNRNIHRIEKILDDFNIVNYTINDDLSIDVDGNVDLSFKSFVNLSFLISLYLSSIFNLLIDPL